LLEAKTDIDFKYDSKDNLWFWVDPRKDPQFQMRAQAEAAAADGRRTIWHAQSAKGYRGLRERARQLGITYLQFVFDPN
jgi:hypothetical protein